MSKNSGCRNMLL
ncbi:hypothetical protein M1702_22835 [Salmonella enterica subsp. enterica serovar Poona]|nr:hypothetical protein [Salmonella enterica subsp. enterica serovar Javiana]MCT6971615.1 hypothetical protein [Salmonella enterica subsp. enterica serovar Albany]MCT7103627.1 hypothetical protein [Salmonella enterica subsp. enterica serovar Poona]